MLQECLIWMLHMFSHIYCKCFICMLHMFAMTFKCFQVFYKCFRRILKKRYMLQVFQLFQLYITGVSSECCKIRYDIAQIAMGIHLPQLLGRRRAGADGPRVHARRKRRECERSPRAGVSHGQGESSGRAQAPRGHANWGAVRETEHGNLSVRGGATR
jgi:hypothetical protein